MGGLEPPQPPRFLRQCSRSLSELNIINCAEYGEPKPKLARYSSDHVTDISVHVNITIEPVHTCLLLLLMLLHCNA